MARPDCDFGDSNSVDILDLAEFADNWLWQACYGNLTFHDRLDILMEIRLSDLAEQA